MTMMTSFGLVLLGVVVGLLSGMLGIGGGILLVPGLMLLFGFSQPQAQGTSLAVLVPPVGIFAAMVYYQHRFIQLNVVACVAAGFLLGAYLGAKLVRKLIESFGSAMELSRRQLAGTIFQSPVTDALRLGVQRPERSTFNNRV